MFTPFRIAVVISVLAHTAFFASYGFLHPPAKSVIPEDVRLNYIIIPDPQIAIDEEIIKKGGVAEDENASEDVKADIPEEEVQNIIFAEQKPAAEDIDRLDESEEKIYDASDNRRAFLEYFDVIREKIRARMHVRLSGEGEHSATIVFTVDPQGNLLSVNDIRTDFPRDIRDKIFSGMKRSHPFPPFPKELGTRPITFSLTVQFV